MHPRKHPANGKNIKATLNQTFIYIVVNHVTIVAIEQGLSKILFGLLGYRLCSMHWREFIFMKY